MAKRLLLVVVLFNLWLNSSLIFSSNRRFYQLLRLHGAPVSEIMKDEALQALVLAVGAIAIGLALAAVVFGYGVVPGRMELLPTALTSLIFAAVTVSVALVPAVRNMALTRFLNTGHDSRPVHFSYGIPDMTAALCIFPTAMSAGCWPCSTRW